MAVKKGAKRPTKNDADAHLRIATDSPTWQEVLTYCRGVLTRSRAILEDPGQSMVNIRQAQGDVRAIRGLLKIAYPAEKDLEDNVPELYASGGPD